MRVDSIKKVQKAQESTKKRLTGGMSPVWWMDVRPARQIQDE
jgi:hypothetical protein